MSVTTAPSYTGAARTVSREIWVARIGVLLLVAWLLLSIALPLWTLLSKSFQQHQSGLLLALRKSEKASLNSRMGSTS